MGFLNYENGIHPYDTTFPTLDDSYDTSIGIPDIITKGANSSYTEDK
jgi:hypothetical protein